MSYVDPGDFESEMIKGAKASAMGLASCGAIVIASAWGPVAVLSVVTCVGLAALTAWAWNRE